MLHAHTDGNSSAIGGHGGLRVVFPPPPPPTPLFHVDFLSVQCSSVHI